MGRLLSLIASARGSEELAEFLFELRTAVGRGEQGEPDWGERLWERASRLLAEQWEVWGEEEVTAQQVRPPRGGSGWGRGLAGEGGGWGGAARRGTVGSPTSSLVSQANRCQLRQFRPSRTMAAGVRQNWWQLEAP